MFSVWNEKNNIFLEKHDRVCLKHKVWLIQFAAQWTEHSSQLKGNSGLVHAEHSSQLKGNRTRPRSRQLPLLQQLPLLAFSLLPMNEKVSSPL